MLSARVSAPVIAGLRHVWPIRSSGSLVSLAKSRHTEELSSGSYLALCLQPPARTPCSGVLLRSMLCWTSCNVRPEAASVGGAKTQVPILHFHPRYKSDISALNISRHRNQSDINLQTLMTYFVVLEKLRFPNNKSPVCESQ